MPSHSYDENEYLPSIIVLSMITCRRCQKGGEPDSLKNSNDQATENPSFKHKATYRVNRMTPQANMSTPLP